MEAADGRPHPQRFLQDLNARDGLCAGLLVGGWRNVTNTTILPSDIHKQGWRTGMALAIQYATGIPAPKCRRYGNIWKIVWTGMYAKCLAAWLYADCSLYLQRKRAIALTFFEWQPKLYRKRHITPKMYDLFRHLLPERA